jgi:hypothetical protein
VDPTVSWWITVLAGGGVIGGLVLLGRGLVAYRSNVRVGDTSTSTIRSLAAGEVRLSGVVDAAEMTLVSLLQSVPCVHYRAVIGQAGDADGGAGITEERSIGFRIRDATGSIRVFPRGARFDAPVRFDDETGALRDEPPGLAIRTGGATRPTEEDRTAAIADLLRIHDSGPSPSRIFMGSGLDRRRHYREVRLEPGDPVTVVGRALPFSDLADPIAADQGMDTVVLEADAEIAADLALARAAGTLVLDPADAWGNAAIPGFGIGRPTATPELDPAATPLPLATPEEAARAAFTFDIAPGTLVLASSAEVPLLIAYGTPGSVMERSQRQLAIGLLGAVVAIASAMVLAINISPELGP